MFLRNGARGRTAPAWISRFASSTNRPQGESNSSPHSTAGPVREFSTTSDPPAPGRGEDFPGKRGRTGIRHEADPLRLEPRPLFRIPGGGVHFRPGKTRDLDGRLAHPAGAGVDQDPFSGPDPGQVMKRIPCGDESDRDGRRFLEPDTGGLFEETSPHR